MMLSAVYGECLYMDVCAPLTCDLALAHNCRREALTGNGDRNYYKKIYIKELHASSTSKAKKSKGND